MRSMIRLMILALALSGPCLSSSSAATCRDPAGFAAFIASIKTEAAAQGISSAAIAALDGVAYSPSILAKDHGQRVFQQSFEQFSARMISPDRLRRGATLLKTYASALSRIEAAYGVSGPVLVALWGLETDFGAVNGDEPTLQALATLAFDCRRTEKFQAELLDALRLVARGDLAPAAMRGAWAGELGQTQFMPSSYLKYAVDFNGNGRRDLIRDPLDALASTANYLKGYGWQAGAGYQPGEPNFAVIQKWNESEIYAKTVAAFATKLAATY
ncbi:lytic murein transglycosylase [Methylocella silvestris]|uniref:Lytic transglycosylase n=1 Tax=Methylocella silvestris TaxID=199596 RepID=A0A2J7TLS6_METSI|nr:lytic murein transglycosylase [Methylocella silvestris]PNG27725.1 lytic transglycosylase [Methylocella silvestris]